MKCLWWVEGTVKEHRQPRRGKRSPPICVQKDNSTRPREAEPRRRALWELLREDLWEMRIQWTDKIKLKEGWFHLMVLCNQENKIKKNASIIKLLTNWLLTFYNSWHGILWVFGEANETADAEEWGNGEKPASRVQMPSQRLLHNTWTLPSLLQPLRTLASHPVVLYFFWAVWYKKRNLDFFFLYFELKILLIFVWWWTARIHTPWKICI